MNLAQTSIHPNISGLRGAGAWCLVVVCAMPVTPLTVFAIPWSRFGPSYEDPTAWRDPVMTGSLSWLGPLYGAQGLLMGVAAGLAALALAPLLGQGALARAGMAGAFGWAILQVVYGGSTAAWYSTIVAGQLLASQPDAAIRKTIGFGDLLLMQGLSGAAAIGALIWLAAVAVRVREEGIVGQGPFVVTVVFGAAMIVAYLAGAGAMAGLIVIVPFAVTGVRLLSAARRAAH